jgi:hypothetical protein
MVRRLRFTSWPENTAIPIVAADVVYNMRSALDHLMCALVPSARRSKVYFPILWQGVWGSDSPGEEKQRTIDRASWLRYVQGVADEAVAILKQLQPPNDGGKSDNDEVHALRVLNVLSTKDRHTKLPVTAPGLQSVTLAWKPSEDQGLVTGVAADTYAAMTIVRDGAELDPTIPQSAVDVQIKGTPVVAVHFALGNADVPLLGFLKGRIAPLRRIVDELSPYVKI